MAKTPLDIDELEYNVREVIRQICDGEITESKATESITQLIPRAKVEMLDRITAKAYDDMHGTFDYDIIAEGVLEEINRLKSTQPTEQKGIE